MKKLSSPFGRLLAVAGCALALGSCNRAEYAMLPKSSTYYGEASSRHAVAAPAVSEQPAVAAAPDKVTTIPAPVMAPAPAVAAASVAPQAAKPMALATPSETATTVATTAAAKPTLVQRMLAKKVMKKLDKMAAKVQQKDATAATARLSGNLRTGIIFLVIALLAGILNPISGIFGVISLIFLVIGIIFLVLWLLDEI